jgi:hypothetical protein
VLRRAIQQRQCPREQPAQARAADASFDKSSCSPCHTGEGSRDRSCGLARRCGSIKITAAKARARSGTATARAVQPRSQPQPQAIGSREDRRSRKDDQSPAANLPGTGAVSAGLKTKQRLQVGSGADAPPHPAIAVRHVAVAWSRDSCAHGPARDSADWTCHKCASRYADSCSSGLSRRRTGAQRQTGQQDHTRAAHQASSKRVQAERPSSLPATPVHARVGEHGPAREQAAE